MKRFLSIICATLIVLSLASVSVLAEGMKIVASDATTAPDGEFAIDINIENNVGIWGTALDLSFDTKYFSVKEIRNNGDVFSNGEMIIGPTDFSQGFVRVFANNNALANKTQNGTLVSIIFNCKKDTPLNDYEFTLSHRNSDPANTCNIDEQTVDVTLVSAAVSVADKKELPQTTTKKGEDLFAYKGEIIAHAVDGGTINSAALDNDAVTAPNTDNQNPDKNQSDNGGNKAMNPQSSTKKDAQDKTTTVKVLGTEMQTSILTIYILVALATLVVIALIVFLVIKFVVKK